MRASKRANQQDLTIIRKSIKLNLCRNDKYASGKSYQSIPEKEYSSSNHFTLGPKVN